MSILSQVQEQETSWVPNPRRAFANFLQRNLKRDCEEVLRTVEIYRRKYGVIMIAGSEMFDVLELTHKFQSLLKCVDAATSVAYIRALRREFDQTKKEYQQYIESMIFTMSLLDGFVSK